MKKELIDFGLSEKESEIYLICLKIGEATANRIADLGGFPRSTTYDFLEKLKHRGFIKTFIKDKKTYFIANNPEVILTSLNEKEREFLELSRKKKEKLKEILPSLKKIQNKIDKKPAVEVIEGITSISRILDDLSENAESLLIIGSQENAIEKIGYRTDRFRMKRKKKGFIVKQILEDSRESRSEKKDKFTEVRFLKSVSDSKEATFICDNITIHLLLSHELTAIRIKSKEYTDTRKIIFKELWKSARK